jgi:hypothetical protein
MKVTILFTGAALAELTTVLQGAFPEVGSRSLPEIVCLLIGVVIQVRRRTCNRALLDFVEVYSGGAAITRAAHYAGLRCYPYLFQSGVRAMGGGVGWGQGGQA